MESTKSNYVRLLKKIQDSNDCILALPNFKIIIDTVESNEDEDREPLYQGHKFVNYSRGKRYILDLAQYIVKKIIDCFEQRYGNLFGKNANVSISSDEGDHVLFDVACLLNCNIWQNSGKTEEENCDRQLKLFQNMISRYGDMEILTSITEDEIVESFLSTVRYGLI